MKRLSITQPYFFPYIGYFSLIKHTDELILFDPVQFIRHGWIERNRILKQNEGWLYIKVPLAKHSQNTLIKDIVIDNDNEWKNKLLSQLQSYKKIAPYYSEVKSLVEDVINQEFKRIVDLNKASLLTVCNYLQIENKIQIYSEMDLQIETPTAADEWALNICKAIGDVKEYWNLPGGQEFFDKSKYDRSGISLKFLKTELKEYNQRRQGFEKGLSIIDVMMFNSPEKINEMLDDYELI